MPKSLASHQMKSAFIIVILFALSVAIRLPYMNRPLGGFFEEITAHTLRIQQIWYEGGALKYKFLPIKTGDNPADKNINNAGRISDQQGNYYYTSYGPLGHIIPYLVFRALHVYPDVQPLRIFGLCVHFLCCLFVYLITSALTRKNYLGRVNIAALMGFSVYLFSPVTLWYHANVNSSEMVVQALFIAAIYIFLRLMTSSHKGTYYGLLGLSVFLMILTEWIGAFFSSVLILYCLLNFRKRSMRIVSWVVGLSSLAAFGLILWHYSQIDGIQRLIQAFAKRSFMMSSAAHNLGGGSYLRSFWKWKTVGEHYLGGYGWFLTSLLCFFLIKKYFLKKDRSGSVEKTVLCLCFWPALLHQLVFLPWTVIHGFSVLKAGFFIALLTALIYSKIDRCLSLKWGAGFSRLLRTQGLLICFCFMTLLSINSYFSNCKPIRAWFETIGKKIARVADKQEVIFLKQAPASKAVSSLIVFYAHRNIEIWKSDQAALRRLELNRVKKGVILAFDRRGNLVLEKHISVDEGGA